MRATMDGGDSTINVSASTAGSGITCSLQLGWQIAYLYALVDDDLEPPQMDTLLPLNQSLQPADQLEVQLRTAAGDARPGRGSLRTRMHLMRSSHKPARLRNARIPRTCAPRCPHATSRSTRSCGRAVEGNAKAYELGNGLSDTYNRICRATRGSADAGKEWREVFDTERIQRLKDRLHDLQSQLRTPRRHCRLRPSRRSGGESPQARQLQAAAAGCSPFALAPPDGYLAPAARRRQATGGVPQSQRGIRAMLRGEMAELVWKRYLPWLPVVILIVGALVMAFTDKRAPLPPSRSCWRAPRACWESRSPRWASPM